MTRDYTNRLPLCKPFDRVLFSILGSFSRGLTDITVVLGSRALKPA